MGYRILKPRGLNAIEYREYKKIMTKYHEASDANLKAQFKKEIDKLLKK